jgi:hypothetical protein
MAKMLSDQALDKISVDGTPQESFGDDESETGLNSLAVYPRPVM